MLCLSSVSSLMLGLCYSIDWFRWLLHHLCYIYDNTLSYIKRISFLFVFFFPSLIEWFCIIYRDYLGVNCYLHVILVTVKDAKRLLSNCIKWKHMNLLLNPSLFLWNCRFLYQEMVETKDVHQFWLRANMKGWGKKQSIKV